MKSPKTKYLQKKKNLAAVTQYNTIMEYKRSTKQKIEDKKKALQFELRELEKAVQIIKLERYVKTN